MYGSDYVVYGAGVCPRCRKTHEPGRQIKETSRSRFLLMQLAAEMTAHDTHRRTPLAIDSAYRKARETKDFAKLNKSLKETERAMEKPDKAAFRDKNLAKFSDLHRELHAMDAKLTAGLRDKRTSFQNRFPGASEGYSPAAAAQVRGEGVKFMLGILVSPVMPKPKVLVATSGDGWESAPFTAAAALKGYEIAPAVNAMAPQPGLGEGRLISSVEYRAVRQGMGYEPGMCAAPRLLGRAFQHPFFRHNYHNWEMSEIYYFPNNDARRAAEAQNDGERQRHVAVSHPGTGDPNCAECKRLESIPVGSLYWVPGLTAHSCETCDNLVPLLMCPA